MVGFKSLAIGILAVASGSADALPTSDAVDAPVQLAERQSQARVTYCEHIDRGGACSTWYGNWNECYNLGNDWDNRISSIRNDAGWGSSCTWYE
ncbi:hypothetical protein V8F20_009543 [Naviculisporaceae sp. PSN 640]